MTANATGPTNDVTPDQIGLAVGDPVAYRRLDGLEVKTRVRAVPPYRGRQGFWVCYLDGEPGPVALCRVSPAKGEES